MASGGGHGTAAALDYSQLAGIYDDYCVFTGDIEYFQGCTSGRPGPILELMAGTGRVSLPLVRSGRRLTCVDSSIGMLAVLRAKLPSAGSSARLVCADVCRLPFRDPFETILLPFQGLTELQTPGAQRQVFREAARVLAAGGLFVATTHNPAVRLRTVDDTWREIGTFPRASGGSLTVALRCRHDATSGLVSGQQRLVISGPDGGEVRELVLDLAFRLVSVAELLRFVEEAGLRLLRLHGDYAGGDYVAGSSPALIAVLGKAGP